MWLPPPGVAAAVGPLALTWECHLPVKFPSVISGPWLKSREQRSRARAVICLDFLSQLEYLFRSLSTEGLSELPLWLLYHCYISCEFSSVALSEKPKFGMPCHAV